jgi:hemin uptake protein HemP
MTEEETKVPAPRNRNAETAGLALRQIESATLLAGAKELVILHGRETYRLRLTAKDKLILTK